MPYIHAVAQKCGPKIDKFEGLYPEADRWILSSPQITSSIGIYSVVITHLYVRLRLRYMIRQRGRIFL